MGCTLQGLQQGILIKKQGTGEKIYGVAPEAQVMFMRVFSDRQKTTGSALYVKAIDDAVALGADTINMSLGSTTGSMAMLIQILWMPLNERVLKGYLS